MAKTDDDFEPMSRKEAAKLCKMDVNTFDRCIRPFLRERRFGAGGGKQKRMLQFLRDDIVRVYRHLFDPNAKGAPHIEAAPPRNDKRDR